MSHAYTAGEPMRRRGLPLRPEQLAILILLGQHATRHGLLAWARPKDLHAHGSAARTSERLRGLVCRDYAEKQEIRPGALREKPIYHYRKLHNLPRGQRVSILERKATSPNGKIRNCYELVIRVGKGKTKAVLLRNRVEKAIEKLFV